MRSRFASSSISTVFFTAITSIITLNSAIGEDYNPVYNPTLHISRIDNRIKIDGELNDRGWQDAGRADNFAEHRPGDQTKPPVKTEALITYDDDYLYIAFICYDDPATIRSSYSDRDYMAKDDNICFLLDTYGDAAWAYELNVNPYGIQADAIWSRNGGEDSGMDLIWDSMGKITDSGYQLEMAVPFSSLRFPDKPKQTWKVDFWRNHPRDSRRQYSWAAYDRDNPCWPCQWGTITGIENVKPGRGIEFLPTVIGFQSGSLEDSDDPGSPWKSEDPDGEASLSVKYSLSSNMTAEATYNPDYSQIESDVAQIDVNTTFALFYPERRPFFQEGSDLFNTYLKAVYTRSVNDPQTAAKLVGRMSRTSIAYLIAHDENSPIMVPLREQTGFALAGRSTSNILRARHTFGEESHVGLLLTDRRFKEGGSGTVFGFDGALRFYNNYRFELQILGSHTAEVDDTSLTVTSGSGVDITGMLFDADAHTVALDGESYSGHNVYAGLKREGRSWWFEVNYNEEAPRFRADNGFVFMNGTRSAEINTGYQFYYDTRLFDNIQPRAGYGRVWTYNGGFFKDEWLWWEIGAQMKAQTFIELGGLISREDFSGIRFNNIRKYHFIFDSKFSDPLTMGFSAQTGYMIARTEDPPLMGKQTDVEFWSEIKPSDRLRITPSLDYSRSTDKETNRLLYEGSIFRSRITYQFTRELFARLVVQYNDFRKHWEFDPLITYRLNSFTVFYLGSTHDFRNYDNLGMKQFDQQIFFKLRYLVQI